MNLLIVIVAVSLIVWAVPTPHPVALWCGLWLLGGAIRGDA